MVPHATSKLNASPRTQNILGEHKPMWVDLPSEDMLDADTSCDSDSASYGDDSFSDSSDEGFRQVIIVEEEINMFAYYCNKLLLFLPIAITVIFRSIGDHEFRFMAISWAIILPFTSDISMDEGVVPALVASSLGYDNSVVTRNMYISIARSRLGLLALLVLSMYTSDYHILGCGVLLRVLVSFSCHILQSSVPMSEVTLICGAVVNIIYHFIGHAFFANITDPITLIASGIAAALPCYPLFVCFVTTYRKTRGNFRQWPLALTIYALYFSVAVYLYFFLFGISAKELFAQITDNLDIITYWSCILLNASIVAFVFGNYLGLDGRRKLWHLCSVLMFVPNWVRDRTFTKLSMGAALVIFIALETARATALPPFGPFIHNMLQSFVDHRDQRGPVIISHFYLLLGISVPIFLANSPAGLICLGLGDTCASQVGRRFGRLRIFGHKSLEGCLAFAVAAAVALTFTTTTHQVWLVVIPTALLEAVTPINDNLIVPMYMLSLQGLLAEKSGTVRTWGF